MNQTTAQDAQDAQRRIGEMQAPQLPPGVLSGLGGAQFRQPHLSGEAEFWDKVFLVTYEAVANNPATVLTAEMTIMHCRTMADQAVKKRRESLTTK